MILLQANQIARYFGADTLFENIQMEISTNSRIALVGRNGAGKSTLLKIIAGIDAPDAGTIAKNKTASLGYLAQDTGLDSNKTVWDEMLEAFVEVITMETRMRELELIISELLPDAANYESVMKEYDRLQHEFSEKMDTAMRMKSVLFYMVLDLRKTFTQKTFIHYRVVKKHV